MELPPKKKRQPAFPSVQIFIPLQLLVQCERRVEHARWPEFLPSAVREESAPHCIHRRKRGGSKYSGIETYYEEVGRRLAGAGHQVTAYCRTYFTPPGNNKRAFKRCGCRRVRTGNTWKLCCTHSSALCMFCASRCDIVHYQALGPALFSFIPRLAGKKTVVTVQGLDWQRKKWGRLASFVLQLGERAAGDFAGPYDRGLQDFAKTFQRSTTWRENFLRAERRRHARRGVNRRKFWNGVSSLGDTSLLLGRFSPEKGCQLLIDAYGKLESKSEFDLESRLESKVQLVMAGASSHCDE